MPKHRLLWNLSVEVEARADLAVSRIAYSGLVKHSFFRKLAAGVLMCDPYRNGITLHDVVLYKRYTYEVLAVGTLKAVAYGITVLFLLGNPEAICSSIEAGLLRGTDIVSTTVKLPCLEPYRARRTYCGGRWLKLYEHYAKPSDTNE